MRNRWGVEVKKGYYAWASGPRGDKVEGVVAAIDRSSDFARAYGPRVTFAGGASVGIDDVSQVLPPMRVTKGGIVKANPTPNLKRYDQPSQRERTTSKGTRTKTASKRLKERRLKTHFDAPPGVWANPLTYVKVKSPSRATKEAPSERLIARRKKTAKAPAGYYANPTPRKTLAYVVYAKKPRDKARKKVAEFPLREFALAYARALFNAHPTWAVSVDKP